MALSVYLRRVFRSDCRVFTLSRGNTGIPGDENAKELIDMPIKEVLKSYKPATMISILPLAADHRWFLGCPAPNLMKSDIFKIDPNLSVKSPSRHRHEHGRQYYWGLCPINSGIRKTVVIYSILLAATSYAFFNSSAAGDHTTIGFYILWPPCSWVWLPVPIIIIKLFPPISA